ncbi:hypothetical protein CW751_11745 [Brumimicrobium salinarum]|uniref:Uncharacterized protein n=1 Tax=Brumimicrobium salinarum TaxID=2058658 RepID=A0A2I0R0G8_9FLAO|nr:hypothetical protein [Brumimicrobium salinarum]PKR80035.1 hypothetical protein CW751_11745 [Brumimicrobium salinarum]
MKSVKKMGVKRFNDKQFDKMNQLIGGSHTSISRPTATYKTVTKSCWYDKDSVSDSALPDDETI